jgi:hypothetical protein
MQKNVSILLDPNVMSAEKVDLYAVYNSEHIKLGFIIDLENPASKHIFLIVQT